ncbi:uncharacterized protein LOC101859923 [Aplysia californica]|uniref:Uncharacterized protein LOC101859923 n=1 Tax=Aplysia californica TaxID=6500 RepID=A0ABM0JK17_APLCA|nr:uncharacterized protein LOC101859923 [Aplysia californica]XP_012936346.2 uncharacterized protein LOC101859923 [Aplysia californica]XP_012936347.2 uncharacterized protein LOC101859923 [Aplysia californica]
MIILVSIITASAVCLIFYLLKTDPPPKAGIYRQPGRWYWLKRLTFKVLFFLRSLRKKSHSKSSSPEKSNGAHDNVRGYGHGDSQEEMEKPQMLSRHQDAIDCCFFGGTDKNGCKLICRLAKRHNQSAEIWLFLDIPGIGCLQHPFHPDTSAFFTDGNSFRAGGLFFEMLEPMCRWKISFSGKLRKGLCNDIHQKPAEYVQTTFSFIWSAFSEPFNTDTDMSVSALGDSLAREKWSRDFFHRLKLHHQTHYDQWGELRGCIAVEGYEEKQLYLQCIRDHSYGTRDWRNFHRYILHYIYLETGMTIHVGVFCQPSLMSHVKIGHVNYANGDQVPVSDIDLKLWEVGEADQTPPSTWKFSFTADGLIYRVEAEGGIMPVWYHHEDRGGKVMEVFTKFKVNSHEGRGHSEFFYRNMEGPPVVLPATCPLVSEPSEIVTEVNKKELILPFASEACGSPALVGGKGAQLALLTRLQEEVNAEVPAGICVTLHAFETQLKENPALVDSIDAIARAAVEDLPSLPSVCSDAVELLVLTPVCPEVTDAVLGSLQGLTDGQLETTRFAVRSSAAGEDGVEASSAGQMETRLGVAGSVQVLEALRACWASVYSTQAVEYRRQHGQSVNVLVGVVIQRMVPAQSAGVLFTCDPISGSNSSLVINANFGLGESVVSGRADPDTVQVLRDPEFPFDPDGLVIGTSRAGEKKFKVSQAGEGGIIEEETTEADSSLCLSPHMILKLAVLGVELEKRFGSPRDIEWAVVNDEIFMLQCRPITVTETETDSDLLHEFDSPMTCSYQWLTTANISEMMPGAVTPLSYSTFRSAIEHGLQTLNMHLGGRHKATHLHKTLPSTSGHLFICLTEVSTILMSTLMVSKDVAEISLLGSTLPELTVDQIQNYFGRSRSVFTRTINFFRMMRMWSKAGSVTSRWEKRIPDYRVGEASTSSVELYQCIDNQLTDYETVWVWTLINSGRSGNWANILLSVMAGDASGWTSEHYGDIALLLSHCQDVYSAEVPHAIENIARKIAKLGPSMTEKVLNTPDTECLPLLQGHPELTEMVTDFLARHGHRCLRESELREKSWRSAPEKFISVVKIMLRTKAYEASKKEMLSIDELLKRMKTSLSFYKRSLMKLLLPKAWAAVGAREWGKSVSVQMSEIFKLAYHRLAGLMHKEGRLPDADLLYFLTHQEIGSLLSSRSARLIIKAQRRRKVLVQQMELRFPKLSRSYPTPVTSVSDTSVGEGVSCLKGMPVSQGQVTGPARVVHKLEEASVIQAGDILVVNSTDVGWSPYFPLIGGLVTELGGLISHGAVVAREYGIPCVVNVANATSIVQSGEKLHLDGRLGLVKRFDVSEPQE